VKADGCFLGARHPGDERQQLAIVERQADGLARQEAYRTGDCRCITWPWSLVLTSSLRKGHCPTYADATARRRFRSAFLPRRPSGASLTASLRQLPEVVPQAARSQSNIPVTKAAITAPSKSIVAPSRIRAVAIEHLPGKAAVQILGGEFPGFNGTMALCGFLCPWVTQARRTRFQVVVMLSWAGLVTRRVSSKGFRRSHPSFPNLLGAIPDFVSLVKVSQTSTTSVFRILARLTPDATAWPVGAAFLART
jgi:hypothetical protein